MQKPNLEKQLLPKYSAGLPLGCANFGDTALDGAGCRSVVRRPQLLQNSMLQHPGFEMWLGRPGLVAKWVTLGRQAHHIQNKDKARIIKQPLLAVCPQVPVSHRVRCHRARPAQRIKTGFCHE